MDVDKKQSNKLKKINLLKNNYKMQPKNLKIKSNNKNKIEEKKENKKNDFKYFILILIHISHSN